MRAECYTADVYCDTPECAAQNSEAGETKAEAHKKLRAAGWRIGRTDLCPRCSGNRPAPQPKVETISLKELSRAGSLQEANA